MILTVVKASIRVEAGWAVGAADNANAEIDRDLLTDPDGIPWVPASSLAGSLRHHLYRHDADQRLMGARPPDTATTQKAATQKLDASPLWVLGTTVTFPDNLRPPHPVVVANTAVDPHRRAAQPKSLRHSRVADRAATVDLYVLHHGELTDEDKDLLGRWQPAIGRDRTRGGGTAALVALGSRTYNLDNDSDLHAWLSTAGPARFTGLTPLPITGYAPDDIIDETFEIVDALHIGTGAPLGKGKPAPIRTRDDTPLVPASTWKGLFRARVGYILRTRDGDEAACPDLTDPDQTRIDQTGCGTCRLCELFGSTGRRGRIAFHDSTITGVRTDDRTHVAIDRVSGGSRDKLLFQQTVVTSGQLRLRITALEPVTDTQHDLLHAVVRDLDDGLIGVGGGTQRGHGTLRLTAVPTTKDTP